MKIANHKKSKVVPKLSGLLLALTTAFLLAACGGGGSSAVGSDSNETVSTSTGSNSSSGSSSSSRGSDDDNCVPPSTPVVAKHGGMDDDDDLDNDDDDDDDDDDKKCAAPLPPLTAADLAAGKLGKTLWATNCFSCHGSDTHEVRTAARILKAIDENKGGMGKLKGVITATDAANIAIYTARPSAF
jgi:cytochrome c553